MTLGENNVSLSGNGSVFSFSCVLLALSFSVKVSWVTLRGQVFLSLDSLQCQMLVIDNTVGS